MTATFSSHAQAVRRIGLSASEVHAVLHADGPALVAEATELAVAAVGPLLERGGFLRPATPRVETVLLVGGPAAIRVTWDRNAADHWPPAASFASRPTTRWWRTDEEETGWPTATLDVIVEPRGLGAQLAVVSPRPPGADLSTNRIDRHLRDRIARVAIEEFLAALVAVTERAARGPCRRDG